MPYDLWAKQGYLTLIPGAVVDPSFVAEAIAEASHEFKIQRIAYDRWRMEYLKREFDRLGADLPIEAFGQGFKEMGFAVDKLERLVAEGKLRHAGNPILTFCAANAVIEMDPAGNRKLAKNKSSGRIDGIVALAMALAAVDREGEEDLPSCIAEFINS